MHLWTFIYSREIIFSLQENNLFIPYKNAHPRQKITIYVTGVLKKDVRINTEELNFLKIKNSFFLRMRDRGFTKNKLSQWFSEVRYSDRAKFLAKTLLIRVNFRVREKQRQNLF